MGISFRGFAIGLVAAAAVSLIVSYAELKIKYIQIGFLQLPPAVVGMFVFLLIASSWAARVRKQFGLSPQELLTVYCMMLFSSMISSRGLLEKVLPLLVTPAYFANEANGWAKFYFPNIKQWMVPFDRAQPLQNSPQLVAKRFFEGLRGGETIPWHQWIGPLLAWGVLALLVFGAFMCLASIIRRQWVDNEKLSFPLAQLPLEMIRDDRETGFFRNRLTWIGFAVPAVVFTVNGLHGWFPSVPEVTLTTNLGQYATNPPVNAIGYTPMFVSFAAIGFLFMLPVEILFSLWFFFVLTRVQQVIGASYNMEMMEMPIYPTKLFIGYQVMGAYFVLAGYLLWVSLPHLKKVIRGALGVEKVNDSNELLPYSAAFAGLILCVLGAALWLRLAGMSPWLAVFELVIFIFIVATVMARSTAEGGLLMTETSFRPVDVYRLFAPTSSLGPANMTVLAFVDAGFFRDLRGLVLTGFLDGLRIGDGARIRRRAFLPVFIAAILIAMVVGGIFQIWLPYKEGGIHLYDYAYASNNKWGFMDYEPAMRGAVSRISWQAPFFFVVGIAVTVFLAYMRYAFFWWPLHPLGYALCASWTMIVFWFPCLIAWIIKSNVMKYGGMRTYVRARPFFLGMIMGEFSMAVVWTIVSWAANAPAPAFPWP
jgi:hypothetical protein